MPGFCDFVEGLLCDREHPSGSDRAVIEEVCVGLDLLLDGEKYQLGHELHGVAGSPVFAGFLVVLLVEPADQVLEYGSHGMVVEAQGSSPSRPHWESELGLKFTVAGEEPLDQCVEHPAIGEPGGPGS